MTGALAALLAHVAGAPAEAVAVLLAIGYLWLAIRQDVRCWPVGMASTAIYLFLLFGARLYLESVLQVFYLGVSGYGWWRWSVTGGQAGAGAGAGEGPRWWGARGNAAAAALVLALATASGVALRAWTPAALPFLDSLTAWGSVVATWMVARRYIENWLWWFVLDALGVYVYVSRGLLLTAALFVLYLVMIVAGWRAWRRELAARAA